MTEPVTGYCSPKGLSHYYRGVLTGEAGMQRLSSHSTYFYKRVFPVFWYGFIAMVVFVMWSHAARTAPSSEIGTWLLPPVVMTLVGLFVCKRLIFDLVDEVWLDGDHLLVKNRGDAVKVALDNVMTVSSSMMTNPPRVSLTLRAESSRLGKAVVFMPSGPRGFLSAFRPSPIATQLIGCVNAVRRDRA